MHAHKNIFQPEWIQGQFYLEKWDTNRHLKMRRIHYACRSRLLSRTIRTALHLLTHAHTLSLSFSLFLSLSLPPAFLVFPSSLFHFYFYSVIYFILCWFICAYLFSNTMYMLVRMGDYVMAHQSSGIHISFLSHQLAQSLISVKRLFDKFIVSFSNLWVLLIREIPLHVHRAC